MSKNLVKTDSPPISPLSGFRRLTPSRDSQSKTSTQSSPAPLLITESRDEYRRLRRALKKEIDPQGPLEKIYFNEIVQQEWEVRRQRRAKVALINLAYREVLEHLLPELICRPGRETWEYTDKARVMSYYWFSDREVQERVAKRLAAYGLDATAIEAKVMQSCHSQVAELDRSLASAESRRTKAIRALAEFRGALRHRITNGNRASETEAEVSRG